VDARIKPAQDDGSVPATSRRDILRCRISNDDKIAIMFVFHVAREASMPAPGE
jgi:hypothetical protein